MKVKAYVRVARDPQRPRNPKVDVTVRPSARPLMNGAGDDLPTVAFALVLDVPDAMFRQAEQVIAEITIPESAATVAADVRVVEPPEERP